MAAFIDGIERIAATCGLSVPTVRYWAETRGELLGIRPTGDGDWCFSPQAVTFFQRLARELQREPHSVSPSSKETSRAQSSAEPGVGAAEFMERFVEMELQIADLFEETKQVQRLLSQLIELLTPMSPPGHKPRVVRPFKPRRL